MDKSGKVLSITIIRWSDAYMTTGRPFAFPAPFAWVQA